MDESANWSRPSHRRGTDSGRWSLWAVTGLTIVGAALRFATINTRGLWLDETTTISQTTRSIWGTILSQVGGTHPPLFHFLMHFWIQWFGTSEVAVRSFAAVFGIASIPVAYWVGRRLYDRRVGLIAALILTFSPFGIWYSQEARMYSMLMFFALLSVGCLSLALEENTRWRWAAYFAVTFLGAFTQYFFLLLLAGQVLYFVGFELLGREIELRRTGERQASRRNPLGVFTDIPTLVPWLVVNSLLAVAVLAWMNRAVFMSSGSPMVEALTSSGLGYGAPPPSLAIRFDDIGTTLVELLTGTHAPWLTYGLVAMWPVLIYVTLLLLGYGQARTRTTDLLMCSLAGIPFIWVLGQWQGVVLLSRYLIPMAAPGLILLAVVLSRIPRRVGKWILVLCVVLYLGLYLNQSFDTEAMLRYQNREAFTYVARRYKPGDVVVYEPFYINKLVDYYLPKTDIAYGLPMFGGTGARDTPAMLVQDLDRVVGTSGRVWVVRSFQNVPDIEAQSEVTDRWFRDNGYKRAVNIELNKIEVLRFDADGSRRADLLPRVD